MLDTDFFLSMYIVKDASSSAQIEGTRATMIDALEMRAGINNSLGQKNFPLRWILLPAKLYT